MPSRAFVQRVVQIMAKRGRESPDVIGELFVLSRAARRQMARKCQSGIAEESRVNSVREGKKIVKILELQRKRGGESGGWPTRMMRTCVYATQKLTGLLFDLVTYTRLCHYFPPVFPYFYVSMRVCTSLFFFSCVKGHGDEYASRVLVISVLQLYRTLKTTCVPCSLPTVPKRALVTSRLSSQQKVLFRSFSPPPIALSLSVNFCWESPFYLTSFSRVSYSIIF